MRARSRTLIPCLMAVVLAACAGPRHEVQPTPGTLLVLSAGTTIEALDSATGAVAFKGQAVAAPANPVRLFRATVSEGVTTLSLIRAADGKVAAAIRVDGDLAIQVISGMGELVAMVPSAQRSAKQWTAIPRAASDIVIADPRGYHETRRYHLKGNYEPEAFSMDGQTLFLINYIPALHPRAYRVSGLDLATGDVNIISGRTKDPGPPEVMAGKRLQQVPAADGTRLFTLYTTQPSEYAKGYDWAQAKADRPVAFVHTLALDEGWALCVGLPKALWGGDAADEAMAFSPLREELFVVDVERGFISVMDSSSLEVVRNARIDLGPSTDQVRAAIDSTGDALFVSTGTRLIRVNPSTFTAEHAWNVRAPILALGFEGTGDKLYVAMGGEIDVMQPATGHVIKTIPTSGLPGANAVAAISP
jgi:hypothetical protein